MSIIPSEERFAKYYKQNSEKDISGVIETVQEKALQTLLDYKINKLPVHLTDICRIKGIRILKNSDAHQLREGEFGLAIKQCEKWYIVYDDTDTIQQIRFTVAHELGHLVLNHNMYTPTKTMELEADLFAVFLLMPLCVLRGIGILNPEEVAALCNVDLETYRYRTELSPLHNMFLSHSEEKVYEQFSNFIADCRKKSLK